MCVFLPKLMSLEKGLEPPRKLSRSRQPCRRAHSKQSWPWARVLWVMSPSEAGDQDQGEAGTRVTRDAGSDASDAALHVQSLSGDNHMGQQHKKSVKNQRGVSALLPFLWKREESKPGR